MLKTNQHVRWGTSVPLPMDIQQLGGHPTQGCWLSWWYRLILIVNISEAEFLSFIYKINRNSFCPASRGHQLHPWGVWTQLWMLISNNRYLSFLSFFFSTIHMTLQTVWPPLWENFWIQMATSTGLCILSNFLLTEEDVFYILLTASRGFPGSSVVKSLPAVQEPQKDAGSIPGLGRSPGGRHGNPLQYSCLENPMDRGAWQATVHRAAKSWIQLKWLSTHTHGDFTEWGELEPRGKIHGHFRSVNAEEEEGQNGSTGN